MVEKQPDEGGRARPAASEDSASEWPSLRDAGAAVAALTALPLAFASAEGMGRSALFYPLVGLLLGAVWLLLDRIAGLWLPPVPRALLAILAWQLLTGARAARALSSLANALPVGRERGRALSCLRRGAPAAIGWSALLGVLILQLHSLVELRLLRSPALVFAPMVACWARVVLAYGSRAARADGRRMKFAPGVSFREFALTSVFSLGVLFSLADATGILAGVAAAALIVALRVLLHWWLDGVTGAALAAGAEITFTAVLMIFGALEPSS